MAKSSRFLFFVLSFSLSFVLANPSFAESDSLVQARPSYWTPTGQNLIPEKALLPILKREELFKLLKGKDKVLFLDIREPHEFQKSHLPNAFNIPFSNREAYYDQLKSSSAKTFIPYCNWDFRGYVAGIELKRHGFSNVVMMYPHGLRGWMAEGLPVAGEEVGLSDEEAGYKLNDLSSLRARQSSVAGEAISNSGIASSSPSLGTEKVPGTHRGTGKE